jgi:hypothetical protein
VGESLDDKGLLHQRLDPRQLVDRDDEIQVEAHDRLGVRIDGLSAHDAIADAMLGEEGEDAIQKAGGVVQDRFPEGMGAHHASPGRIDHPILAGGRDECSAD